MAIIRLIGKVEGGVACEENTDKSLTKKFKISVLPVGAKKKSFFAVEVKGPLAVNNYCAGQTLDIEGTFTQSMFGVVVDAPEAEVLLVKPMCVEFLAGSPHQRATAYNVLGNLCKDTARIFETTVAGKDNMYSQSIAIRKDKDNSSYYNINMYGKRGEALLKNKLMDKSIVKSILVSGAIKTEYKKKPDNSGFYFNVYITPGEYQVAEFVKRNSKGLDENGTDKDGISHNFTGIDLDEIPF